MKTDKIFSRYNNDNSALKLDCYNLMKKCYLEIGQKPSDEQVKLNASFLYEDLIHYYGNMTMDEVAFVFHKGIRNADEGTNVFINVRQWSVWLKDHKKLEALKRQQKLVTSYDKYRANLSKLLTEEQKLISDTINKAKKLK